MTDSKLILRGTLVLVLCLAFMMQFAILVNYGGPAGSDVGFHVELAQNWVGEKDTHPDVVGTASYGWGPYPPAFHWLLGGLHLVGLDWLLVVNILSLIFYPMILLAAYWVVRDLKNEKVATLVAVLMLASFAIWDRGSQVTPQAIEMILFPVALWAFMRERDKVFVLLSVLLVYSHSAYSLGLLGGVFLYDVYRKRGKVNLIPWFLIAILLIPLAVHTLSQISAEEMMAFSGKYNNAQEKRFMEDPYAFLNYLGWTLVVLTPFAAIHLVSKKKKCEFERALFFWFLGMVPIGIFFIDRFGGYLAQLLAVVIAIALLDNVKNEKGQLMLITSLLLVAVLMFVIPAFYVIQLGFIDVGQI